MVQSKSAADVMGLIAGNGMFPRLFAQAARRQRVPVWAVAMRGETEPQLEQEVERIAWVRVGQLGATRKKMHSWGLKQAAMAGGVDKRNLFSNARPDLLGLRLLMRQALKRDDSILRQVAASFEQVGIEIISSTVFLPDALAPEGVLTHAHPSAQMWHDLRYGLGVARTIGALDIGQTVVVRAGQVVALEAIEGTDACIRRSKALIDGKGAIVVKAAKPNQDMRFDVPAVGVRTIEALHDAHVMAMGMEAGRTLMLEPEETIAAANRYGITLVGLS